MRSLSDRNLLPGDFWIIEHDYVSVKCESANIPAKQFVDIMGFIIKFTSQILQERTVKHKYRELLLSLESRICLQ